MEGSAEAERARSSKKVGLLPIEVEKLDDLDFALIMLQADSETQKKRRSGRGGLEKSSKGFGKELEA